MKHNNQGLALFLLSSLLIAGVSCHTVVWCFGRDALLNDIVAMGSYHGSTQDGWNSATTVISTSNGEPWGPTMPLSNWILEPTDAQNSNYFGCGFSCTAYCSGWNLSNIRTWQVKVLDPGTFTEGVTYGIAQSSTHIVDTPDCSIPGGGATFPILPPIGEDTITCPADQTITQTSCQAVATWADPSCTAACPDAICGSERTGPISGTDFAAGTTTITYELTLDTLASGLTCSFDIIVVDNTDPSFATGCPADQTFCGPGPQPFTWTPPTFTDCNTPTVMSSHNSGDSFPTGTTTVTYVADDGQGNSLTCSFDITVYSDPPTIACPSDFTVGAPTATPGSPGGSSSTTFTASYTVTGTDSCGNPLGTNQLAGAPGSPATIPYASLPMTFTYETDPDPVTGQQPTCSFTVSGAFAEVTSVSQPAGLYRFGDASNPPPANVGELGLYIPTTLCWRLVNTSAAGDVGTLVIHDGTNVIHTFARADDGTATFPLDMPGSCMEFLGPHQVNIGEYYLGVMGTTTALANNWPAFELHAIIDWY